ncbi:hypothetical protein [Yinghuangia soli]|uniref:Uncharacterized protein n=1 Tax=Yinghuangia soli TaxID=2908204 RepID=A0AA41Q2X6_9ACTN|nr:hypothetical protein [Yinghuangia soli]MCF2530336.1 hypothetical protein [Yinghuangia soli]
MPDELGDLARAAAANVVTAIGTEGWPRVRSGVVDLLARNGQDPAWVDTFGTMITTADGREQNSLRDAAYARYEAVFAAMLAARPAAAAEIALLVLPTPGGAASGPATPAAHGAPPAAGAPSAPGAPGAPGAPAGSIDMVKQPDPPQSSGPGGRPYPQPAAQQPYQETPFAPPVPPGQAPPMPPGPAGQPGSYPGAHPGSMPGSMPGQQPGQQYAAPYGASAPGAYPPPQGAPYPGAPNQMAPGPGAPAKSSGKVVLGTIVALAVVAGAIFGGIALFGGDDDDKCSNAAGRTAPYAAAALVGGAPQLVGETDGDCTDPGGVGPAGNAAPTGGKGDSSDGKGGSGSKSDIAGNWNGTFNNEKPVQMDGPFTVKITQENDELSADIKLTAGPCSLSGKMTGRMNGQKVSFFSSMEMEHELLLEGTLSSGKLSGTYTTTCNGAEGTWTARKG